MIIEINSNQIKIKKLSIADLEINKGNLYEDVCLANSNFGLVDFIDFENFPIISILNLDDKIISHLGTWGKDDWISLPSSGGENVSFLIEDTKEAVMDFIHIAGTYNPNSIYWYKINGQLICQFWYD